MDVLSRVPPKADKRISYGAGPLQFGDLWLPKTPLTGGKWPVLVFVHGGWWQAQYDLDYAGFLCDAMRNAGVAVWSLEYRRVGNPGGGWPGTFEDVAAGMDFVAKLAESYPLDTARVIAAGHSAGGHLAFWLAGRHHIPAQSALAKLAQPKVALKGVVALAGAVDLRLTIDLGGSFQYSSGGPATRELMGGGPKDVPDRYAAGNPAELLPLGVPQVLVQGTEDDQIPAALPERWAAEARKQGDHVDVKIVRGAGHFDVVDPQSKAWAVSREAMVGLVR